jgi:hypothetical protein
MDYACGPGSHVSSVCIENQAKSNNPEGISIACPGLEWPWQFAAHNPLSISSNIMNVRDVTVSGPLRLLLYIAP